MSRKGTLLGSSTMPLEADTDDYPPASDSTAATHSLAAHRALLSSSPFGIQDLVHELHRTGL
jgi:hypothetical protein